MSRGVMMGKRIKVAVATVACGVALATGIWLGVIWEASRSEPVEQKTVVVEPISEGVETGEVYSTEIWEDGEVRVYTQIRYVNQVSEHTLVISDRSLEDVWQEIGGVKK